MHLKKKNFATMILWKKVILSCLKTNLKISHNLRLPDIFVKRFKPSKRYIATAELVKPPIWYLFKPLIMFKEDCFGLRNGGGRLSACSGGTLSNTLKWDSHLSKKLCYLLHWKPFKNHKKCFLFHLTSSFRSQDI